jgi:hypothetical protein
VIPKTGQTITVFNDNGPNATLLQEFEQFGTLVVES